MTAGAGVSPRRVLVEHADFALILLDLNRV
jgi:hypothetical protein